MGYSKTPKTDYALVTQLITVKELTAVSEFIREFKLKYTRKRRTVSKKK
ncbi:MAG: hypothetical protein H7Y86_22430 [Rhizobacter sp.]|nr:hypothetical protein [Ferruginibacter sp.]